MKAGFLYYHVVNYLASFVAFMLILSKSVGAERVFEDY